MGILDIKIFLFDFTYLQSVGMDAYMYVQVSTEAEKHTGSPRVRAPGSCVLPNTSVEN